MPRHYADVATFRYFVRHFAPLRVEELRAMLRYATRHMSRCCSPPSPLRLRYVFAVFDTLPRAHALAPLRAAPCV